MRLAWTTNAEGGKVVTFTLLRVFKKDKQKQVKNVALNRGRRIGFVTFLQVLSIYRCWLKLLGVPPVSLECHPKCHSVYYLFGTQT